MHQGIAVLIGCGVFASACATSVATFDSGGSGSGTATSTSGAGGEGAGGAGGATGMSSSGTASSGATTATASSSSTGGAGGGTGDCDPACGAFFTCCDGICRNVKNDPLNCGKCGEECTQEPPFCDNGTCAKAPCADDVSCDEDSFCCDAQCCKPGQLCCVIEAGPVHAPACMDPTDLGTCPVGNPGSVCAHPDTPIATPDGERPIASLKAGDLVYSVDAGVLRAVPLLRVIRRAVDAGPGGHRVMAIELESGQTLLISAAHPTADGRRFGALTTGDTLAGVPVVQARAVLYGLAHTYDILPDSDSGAYFAGGALIGSTLRPEGRAPDAAFAAP